MQFDKLSGAVSSVSFSLSYSKTNAGKEKDVIQGYVTNIAELLSIHIHTLRSIM